MLEIIKKNIKSYLLSITKQSSETKPTVLEMSWAIFNQIILSLGAFILVMTLSRLLSHEIFGETRYVAAVLAILSLFSLPGVGSVITQRISQISKKGIEKIIKTQLRWGLIVSGTSIILFLFYMLKGQTDLSYAFLVGGLFAPIANLYQVPGLMLAGLKKFRHKTIIDGIIMTFIILGAGMGAWFTHTVSGTFLFYFGMQSIATVIMFVYVKNRFLKNSTGETSISISEDSEYSKQLTLFLTPLTLIPSIEKVLLFILLGSSPLAFFAVAVLPIDHIKSAFRNFLQFLALPYLKNHLGNSKLIKTWLGISIILTVLGIIALLLFINFVMPILFPAYRESLELSFLLILAIVPLPTQIFIFSLITTRHIKSLFLYAGFFVGITIINFLIFVPLFGLYGAVIAKIITEFIAAVIIGVLYIKKKNIVTEPHGLA